MKEFFKFYTQVFKAEETRKACDEVRTPSARVEPVGERQARNFALGEACCYAPAERARCVTARSAPAKRRRPKLPARYVVDDSVRHAAAEPKAKCG